MKQIEDLIKQIKKSDLENANITYEDGLGDDDLNKGIGINYWLSVYYSGSITDENHCECKKNNYDDEELKKLVCIYDYILNPSDKNFDDIDANTLAQLWIMRPRENFKYEDKFKELISSIYDKCGDNRFREIALERYGKNSDKDLACDEFLIKPCEKEEYKKKYGIGCEVIKYSQKSDNSSQNSDSGSENDWISKKFSEVNNGDKTRMEN